MSAAFDLAANSHSGEDMSPLYDFAMCGPVDAQPADVDAAGFCDGTPLAGTCLQPLFQRFAECFVPAGCCTEWGANSVRVEWASGAELDSDTLNFGDRYYGRTLGPGNYTSCLHAIRRSDGQGYDFHFPDTTVTINPTTGDVTCSDGSQVNIGLNLGDCGALNSILGDVRLHSPIDFTKCQSATCCTPSFR